jgi:hypothetical protein
MKQISIFFLFFLYFFSIHAQDAIKLKNTKVLHAYITEKSDTKIKYKTDSIHADTTYSAKLSEINSIHYGNGEVDLLSSQNPRSIFPLGINYGFLVAGGNTMAFYYYPIELTNLFKAFFVSVDYLVTPKISAEVSVLISTYGYTNLFSLGGKYWFANKYGKSGFSPFVGLFVTQLRMRNDYEDITYYNKQEWSIYYLPEFPVGISYISKHGFQASVQLDNYMIFASKNRLSSPDLIELRIGWRFKTGKKGYKRDMRKRIMYQKRLIAQKAKKVTASSSYFRSCLAVAFKAF